MYDEEIAFIEDTGLDTPVTFYSERLLYEPLDLLQTTLPAAEVYYALKSCYHPPLLRALKARGIGVEVLSELEFDLAETIGFKNIIVNGMGRSESFLRKAATAGSIIIIDTVEDIKKLENILQGSNQTLRIGFRLSIERQGYQNNSYFKADHPLGNDIDDNFFRAFASFCKDERVEWEVLHAHFTINETAASIYETAIRYIVDKLKNIKSRYNLAPYAVDIGGGFEVYDPERQETLRELFNAIQSSCSDYLNDYKIIVEPGRYLSAYAGYTLGKVCDVKTRKNKTWLVTDIGTNTLIPIPNARYTLRMPTPTKRGKVVGITDGITSPANNVIEAVKVSSIPKIGDFICVGNTGAYTDVYSTFWAYTPHRVCFVDAQGHISIYRSNDDIAMLKQLYLH